MSEYSRRKRAAAAWRESPVRRGGKLLLVGFAAWLALLLCSTPGGLSWFSPDTLETKRQGEWLVFLVGLPVFRTPVETSRSDLASFLIEEGYWRPQMVDHPRWLATNHWNRQWRDGHSQLHRELYWNSEEWIEWTERHPELATAVWPYVLRLLREHPDSYDTQGAVFTMLWGAKQMKDCEELKQWMIEMQGKEEFPSSMPLFECDE